MDVDILIKFVKFPSSVDLHAGMFHSCSKSLQQKEITLITLYICGLNKGPPQSGWKQLSSWGSVIVC
jgi:hypothetical protein